MSKEWEELNQRQRKYMQAIYETDQEQESWEKGAWQRGEKPRKAEIWRWMDYATLDGVHEPVKMKLFLRKLIDHGTGSTFEALEKRGLIICRYSDRTRDGVPVLLAPGERVLAMQITVKERKVVRAALDEPKTQRLPPGTLREWHWKAMVAAWKTRPTGVIQDGNYGHIGWNTWLRLRDYKAGGLVKEYSVYRGLNSHTGFTFTDYYIRLTPFGEQYYCENWQKYRELYPDVDAPEPIDREETQNE